MRGNGRKTISRRSTIKSCCSSRQQAYTWDSITLLGNYILEIQFENIRKKVTKSLGILSVGLDLCEILP